MNDRQHAALIAALEQAERRLDRHRQHLGRLYRYHDECPDGDPRKVKTEADIDRVLKQKNAAEHEAGAAADALIAFEDSERREPADDADDEAEGVSIADVDELTRIAAAWHAVSSALDQNAAGGLSAGDVAAVGFAMQERLKDADRRTWSDMLRGPVL